MTTYMGPNLASMVPVECLTDLTVTPVGHASEATNMSGHRRIYLPHPGTPTLRTWACSIDAADPADLATLHELESLRVGLRMITDSAAVNNILPPSASVGPVGWFNSEAAGPVTLEGGGMAATSTAPTVLSGDDFSPLFPVVPGIPVRASIFLRATPSGAGRVALDWMAPGAAQNGGALSTPDSESTTNTTTPLSHLTVGAVPPSNVFAARLRLTGVAQFARLAVTWTEFTQPYRPGEGAEEVYLPAPSQSPLWAWADQSVAAYQYTVMEATP